MKSEISVSGYSLRGSTGQAHRSASSSIELSVAPISDARHAPTLGRSHAPTLPRSYASTLRLYFDRTAGGDSDHSDPRFDVAPCALAGQDQGALNQVHEQPQATYSGKFYVH